MNNQNNLLILLISIITINLLISYNISDIFNDSKEAVSVFAQETVSGEFLTYTNEEYGITMQYPSDWSKTEGGGEVKDDEIINVVFFTKDIDYSTTGVSLFIDSNQSISLQEYLSNTTEKYKEEVDPSSSTCSPSSSTICPTDFEIINSSANTDKTLAGYSAYILEYTMRYQIPNTVGDTIERYLDIGAKIGNNYYFVQYGARGEDAYFKSLPIVQKMIDSIKIGNDAATSPLSSQSQQPEPQQLQEPQNINNLNQQQLVDLIATTISNANNIDKNKIVQTVNDMIEPIKSKGGNVIESLKRIANVVSKDPSGVAANNIINAANKK